MQTLVHKQQTSGSGQDEGYSTRIPATRKMQHMDQSVRSGWLLVVVSYPCTSGSVVTHQRRVECPLETNYGKHLVLQEIME